MSTILKPLDSVRKCYTMADVVSGKKIDGIDTNDEAMHKFVTDPFMKTLARKHDLSTDTVAALTEASNIILEANEPSAIGRSLVRTFETTASSLKIRRPRYGKAAKTSRAGTKTASAGKRNDYMVLTPTDEIEASDQWDRSFLEDAEYDVAREEAQAVSRVYDETETEIIVDFLNKITAANLAGGSIMDASTAGVFQWDDIVNLWGRIHKQRITPNVLAMNTDQYLDILKDDDFKNSLMLGEFVDLSSGLFGRLILGMDVYVSEFIPERTVFALNTDVVGLFCLRRDKILQTFQPTIKDYQLAISSRYSLDMGLGYGMAKITNA